MSQHHDYPLHQVRDRVDDLIKAGATCFQKFTCATCRTRQSCKEPNVFGFNGKCGHCGSLTNLVSSGCGFMVIYTRRPLCS